VVLQTTTYRKALNWYLDNLGMIVSDFLYFPGRRDRGPAMSVIRCDRGATPTDHHTVAMALGPSNRYLHSIEVGNLVRRVVVPRLACGESSQTAQLRRCTGRRSCTSPGGRANSPAASARTRCCPTAGLWTPRSERALR
jgi:hypothetical protein